MASLNAANASSKFNVHIKSMTGNIITIECHDDMTISSLIDKLLVRLPEDQMAEVLDATLMLSVLNNKGNHNYQELSPSDVLRDKNIVNDTELLVVYRTVRGSVSCTRPFPNGETLSQKLHQWIEAPDEARRIDFDHRFQPEEDARLRRFESKRNVTLLLNHNNWEWDKMTAFTLTNSLNPYPPLMAFDVDSQIMASTVRYIESENTNALVYYPTSSIETHQYPLEEGSIIKGKLYSIKIVINQSFRGLPGGPGRHRYFDRYERYFIVQVILKSPITILNQNGDILHSFLEPNDVVGVPYQKILMCDANGNLLTERPPVRLPNNPPPLLRFQGGRCRHTKKSKRTRKSKRTKNKRKTRSR